MVMIVVVVMPAAAWSLENDQWPVVDDQVRIDGQRIGLQDTI